jgi:hypothetical protein
MAIHMEIQTLSEYPVLHFPPSIHLGAVNHYCCQLVSVTSVRQTGAEEGFNIGSNLDLKSSTVDVLKAWQTVIFDWPATNSK